MRSVEKQFVNSARHSQRVAEHAESLVRSADPQPGQRLLDVGCGNGAAPIHLATTFALEVTGVDIDPEQILAADAARADLTTVRFLVADAIDLPFQDGEFDLVHTNKTTHHIHHWEQALTEMVRVLKPGGCLLYSDFVAPFGKRLPTRRALNRFAAEHRLEEVRHSSSPVRYIAIFRREPLRTRRLTSG